MEFVRRKNAKYYACKAFDNDDEDSSLSSEDVKRPPISSISFMIRASSSNMMLKKEQTENIKKKETLGRRRLKKHLKEADKPKYETDISAKRKVVVKKWKGITLVSMRQYYEKDGKDLPGCKGISLTTEQFKRLAKASDDVDTAISSTQ